MSELAEVFEAAVEPVLCDGCTPAAIDAAEHGEFPTSLWDALSHTGVPLLLAPEAAGGLGADLADAAAVMRAAGRHAAPGPILETVLANALLGRAGREVGAEPVGLAVAGAPAAWGAQVRQTLLVTRDGVFLQARRAAEEVPPGASGEPLARFHLEGAERLDIAADLEGVRRTGAALRASQAVGALSWALQRTVEFAGERRQFGREIGKFQVIQQHLAAFAGEVAAAAAITSAAVEALDRDFADDHLLAAARSRLGDAIDTASALAHQVHGAIGFTREYPLNYRTRRLIDWRDDFGTVADWRRRLADRVMGLPATGVWAAMSR